MTGNLLVHGGPIFTMNREQPLVEAVGIVNGRVRAVGDVASVRKEMGTRFDEIDLNGRLASPGLYDAHAHIIGTGVAAAEIEVNADRVSTIADIQQLVKERVAEASPERWVIGQGYDQQNLAE